VTDRQEALKRHAEVLKKPVGRYGPEGTGLNAAIHELGLTDEARKLHVVAYKPQPPLWHYWGSKQTDYHWFYWKVSGDIRFLEDSYKRVCEWFYSHDWLNGPAQPSLDRNPLPRGSVIRSRIGALAANRGSSGLVWPRYALSYTGGGDEVAALMTENVPNRFSMKLYPSTEEPHDLQIRVWRCNGLFDVTLERESGEVFRRKQVRLDRGAYLDVRLPPKQVSILNVKPVKVEPVNFDKADPAISLNSIEMVYGGHLVVRVYNNGTKPVTDVLVRVRDARSGKIVINGEKHTGAIETPTDMRPRFKTVEFKNLSGNAWGRVIIEIDPERETDDLTRHNNRVDFDYRGVYDLHEGWH
jgi:hypothetical protein